MDKLTRVKQQIDGLAHAEGSAAWLASQGYPELGPAIVGHPVTRLADAAWFEEWLAAAPPESLIVAYADKRAGQRLESMAVRFASWNRRYPSEVRDQRPGAWTEDALEPVRLRADRLERRVCELAAVAPADVRRLRWTGRALAAARVDAVGATAATGESTAAGGRR